LFGLMERFVLEEGCEAAFDALTEETTAFVWAAEPDTLIYACHRMRDNPRARVFYALYRSEEAFRFHREMEHIKRFLRERERYLSAPPEVAHFDLLVAKGIPGGAN
jgi:quinol monooxygenase YgiN